MLGLAATAIFQAVIAILGGSAALLADTIHNAADLFTAAPLWIAFVLSRREANRRFTYGYDRAEDIAGAVVLLFIVASAGLAAWESVQKLLHPQVPRYLGWGIAAGVAGVIGNELVAQYRIGVGREIGSTALVADGQHARVDGLTSLGVVAGLIGVSLGYGWADPVAGLAISALIVRIAWDVGHDVLGRLMDSIDPATVDHIEELAAQTAGVRGVHDIRARWTGHQVLAELHLDLDPDLTLAEAHTIGEAVRHTLLREVVQLRDVVIHVDPAGPAFHHLADHHSRPQEAHHPDSGSSGASGESSASPAKD